MKEVQYSVLINKNPEQKRHSNIPDGLLKGLLIPFSLS